MVFFLRLFVGFCLIVLGNSTGAIAQEKDIQTSYSTQKGGCTDEPGIEIAEGVIAGTIAGEYFMCKLGTFQPAGTGLVSYQSSVCVVGEQSPRKLEGSLALDLGNFSDHFKMALPDQDWISLYPCTPVPGLN